MQSQYRFGGRAIRTYAVLVLAASVLLAPGTSGAQGRRDVIAAQIEARAQVYCSRALAAKDVNELFAIEAVINNTLQTWNKWLQQAKSEYEKRRNNLLVFREPRDNFENQLIAHTTTGGSAYDPVGIALTAQYGYFVSQLSAEETEVAKLRHKYTTTVASAYATGESLRFVLQCVELSRAGLKEPSQVAQAPAVMPPPSPGDIVRCTSSEGPFRCTGQFPATWTLTCSIPSANDGGPAVLMLYPDGAAQAQFTSRIAGNRIDPVIGRISPSGAVLVERNDGPGGFYRWQGQFSLQAPAPGVVKAAGGATMTYRDSAMNCDGRFTLR